MFGNRREGAFVVAARMAGDATATGKDLDGAARNAQFHFLAHQCVRHAVIVVIEFDVIVDVDGCAFPLGQNEPGSR
jgi:hypothetical protein